MHNQYKSALAYVKRSYERDPTVTFFQKVIDAMKKLKVSTRDDFGSFWIWQGSRLLGINS